MQITTKPSCQIKTHLIMHHQKLKKKNNTQASEGLNTNSPIHLKHPNGIPEKVDSSQTRGLIRTHQWR
jgi:hypothetical protein